MTVAHLHGIQRMSAAGNPYGNTYAESFFHSFKMESIDGMRFAPRSLAEHSFAIYMLKYNRKRSYSALDEHSPVTFELGADVFKAS